MLLFRETPLSWKNLTHDRRRLATAIAGIAFAVLLMFVQVGFQNALYDSQLRVIDALQGEVFIVSRARFAMAAEKRFPRARLYQARSCPDVTGAYPLYAELTASTFRNISSGSGSRSYPIRSLAYVAGDPVFDSSEISRHELSLEMPMSAVIDRHSKQKRFDLPMNDSEALANTAVELADHRIRLVGTFQLGTDFVHDGNLVMSAETFSRLFPYRTKRGSPLSVVDIGVVHVTPGVEPRTVCDRLAKRLDQDVAIYVREELRDKERRFWQRTTPIGAVFSAGKIIGFVVGVVICYQVIFSDISDHMSEFATLKAMGYSDRYFVGLIVCEAIWLSILGFVPGAIASASLYAWLGAKTGLLMQMTGYTLGFVLVTTLGMCIASGLLAVRKLLTADPVSLF